MQKLIPLEIDVEPDSLNKNDNSENNECAVKTEIERNDAVLRSNNKRPTRQAALDAQYFRQLKDKFFWGEGGVLKVTLIIYLLLQAKLVSALLSTDPFFIVYSVGSAARFLFLFRTCKIYCLTKINRVFNPRDFRLPVHIYSYVKVAE